MKARRILVPVCSSMDTAEIARSSFWLARKHPAKLYVMELNPPRGFREWLGSFLGEKRESQRLAEIQRSAAEQKHLGCEIGELRATTLPMGIARAARQVKPDIIVLPPELHERLGQPGLCDLMTRLRQVRRCLLLFLARGPALRVWLRYIR